jgi:hypothetical protein
VWRCVSLQDEIVGSVCLNSIAHHCAYFNTIIRSLCSQHLIIDGNDSWTSTPHEVQATVM